MAVGEGKGGCSWGQDISQGHTPAPRAFSPVLKAACNLCQIFACVSLICDKKPQYFFPLYQILNNVCSMAEPTYTYLGPQTIVTSLAELCMPLALQEFKSHIFKWNLTLKSALCGWQYPAKFDNLPQFTKLQFICHLINSFNYNSIISWITNSKATQTQYILFCAYTKYIVPSVWYSPHYQVTDYNC